MFTYNFRRLLNLIGIALFKKLMIAIKEDKVEDIKQEIAEYIAHSMAYRTEFFEYIKLLLTKPRYFKIFA